MPTDIDLEMNTVFGSPSSRGLPAGSSRASRPQNTLDHDTTQRHGIPPGQDQHTESSENSLRAGLISLTGHGIPSGHRKPAGSVEKPPKGALTMPVGYPRLAELMGQRPQMGIYKRFAYLNAQNLLYMQAELVCLEKKLKRIQKQEATDIGGYDDISKIPENSKLLRALDWECLSKAKTFKENKEGRERMGPKGCCEETEPHEHCEQWLLALTIREKLQRYNETLIQQMTLASAGAPGPYDLEWVQHFLTSEKHMKKGALQGEDKLVWGCKKGNKDADKEPSHDLVALAPPPKQDFFREWISKTLVRWILNRESLWHGPGAPKHRGLEEKTLLRWTMATTSAATSTFPILSIVVLYFTHDRGTRLALLAVFNLLAAFVLTICTDAQPMQVFAASAAYSAVNIVFVGTNATASS